MKNPRVRYYEQTHVGDAVTSLQKGPMSSAHLMRWSAAIENWHRIHYDYEFATDHDGLPDLLVNGSWKQHVLAQMLKDWAGPTGWLYEMRFQYRGMDLRGSTLTAFGKVVERKIAEGIGVVICDIGMHSGNHPTTTGHATVLLPLEQGRQIPNPVPELVLE